MDLQSLKYFQYVAMYRNFSRAAEHFYIGQSALSRQIANLEKELGVQLFVRDTRNVSLTDAGEVLYEHGDLLLRHHELIYRLLEATKTGHAGQLGIATVANFGVTFIPVVERFIAAYPKVKARVDDIPFDELADSIIHGVYDVAIMVDYGVPQNESIVQRTIDSDHFVVVMRDDYRYTGREPIPLADLLEQQLIIPRHVDPPVLRRLRLMGQARSVEYVPNTQTALLRVDLGLGVTLVPKRIISASFTGSRFRFCELADVDTRFDIVAIHRKDNQQQTLTNFLAMIGR
ncbi:MAG: LysR family transcriptional regulator [Propionibacteriaceae bacterium]|nr:LysR family transcriptional regulator [Propionibacteriaceae bacterium]